MTQSEFLADYRLLAAKVLALEEGMQRLLDYIARERQAAIMLVGQADDALQRERTIPKHGERRKV